MMRRSIDGVLLEALGQLQADVAAADDRHAHPAAPRAPG